MTKIVEITVGEKPAEKVLVQAAALSPNELRLGILCGHSETFKNVSLTKDHVFELSEYLTAFLRGELA